ncbi:MAG: YHS domain-containing protein [Candidatus Levybacteria bacterium]|nr:YHS domain-containing protein [Candidatus Levybacteria bacterium]
MIFGLFNKATDPVCKMKINKKSAKFSLEKDGSTYYFCSESCKGKFSADQNKYLKEEGKSCCH